MFESPTPIEALLTEAAQHHDRPDLLRALTERRAEAFEALATSLRSDLPIDTTERYERVLKDLIDAQLAQPLDGERIRELARFQRELGFLLKYKSYAVKASSPLGYSVFLQNQGEGFSFQRHTRHKTEIFQILDVLPGGCVFLCESDEWQRMYRRESFDAWLNGQRGLPYDRFRYEPHPGDVIVIDRLNVVHTVVGCTLAEFATVSTDMVDRLHDQNEGRPIPAMFSREYAERRLRSLPAPGAMHRVVVEASGAVRTVIPSESMAGGSRTRLGEGSMVASLYAYEPGGAGAITSDGDRATSLHVVQGNGTLLLGDAGELRRISPPALAVSSGDLLLVAPGGHYGFLNPGSEPLHVAEHRIALSTAFVR